MRILIDSGSPTCTNLGDVAMLQVAVARLLALWPGAEVRVLTDDPARLERHCPETLPASEAGRRAWCDGVRLPSALNSRLPSGIRRFLELIQGVVRHRCPRLYRAIMRSPLMFGRQHRAAVNAFLDNVAKTDLYVICGQATLTDDDRARALRLLGSASLALAQGIPAAMFGQGIGPLSDSMLIGRASQVLPSLRLVAIREAWVAAPLLQALKVPPDRVVLTGDDAVELAWGARTAHSGTQLGIHLRMAPLALPDMNMIEVVARVVRQAAQEFGVGLVPLPISHHARLGAYDPAVLKHVVEGCSSLTDGGASIDTPFKVIAAAGACRIVVTGAYHAAVFALSQGIPAICLGRSPYYLAKFHGLADMFRGGCIVLDLRAPDYASRLATAVRMAWARADEWRDSLLAGAGYQVQLSRAAYANLAAQLTCAVSPEAAQPAPSASDGPGSLPKPSWGVAS